MLGRLFTRDLIQKPGDLLYLIIKIFKFEAEKIIADPNGRFVVVTGKLLNKSVILASIYARNWDHEAFIKLFFTALPKVNSHFLIIGRDFNTVLSPELDRSVARPHSVIQIYIEQYGSFEAGRFNQPEECFLFFSPVHNTYSRIGYFCLDTWLLPITECIIYHSIVILNDPPFFLLVFP